MNAPLRRGACPALSAPMPTGDGLMIRLSPASGGFSPKQLIGLCESAARHGNGIVEVTARGSCQFRGFSAASAERFAEDVESLSILVRTGVPVEISPLAGIDPMEIGDAAALARLIRDGIDASGLTGRLGPKVSVVVDGGGQISLGDIAADVRLTASRCNGEVLWRLAIADEAETATQVGWHDDNGAVRAALSVLGGIAERGLDARAKDFAAGEALNRLRSFAPPSVLADSGRTAAGAKERGLAKGSNARDDLHSGYDAFCLHANRHALPISLPFGSIDAAILIDLARCAETLGIADIRPAPRRTLLPVCPSLDSAQALHERAEKLGFVTVATDPRRSIAACAGAPACASGKIAARTIAEQVARSFTPGTSGVSIHISGCQKGCARQAAADITIVGGENGAGLVVHGTTKSKPLAYRSAGGLARSIAAVASKLQAERQMPMAKTTDRTTTTLSSAQLACLKAAFEQDGP